MDNITPDKRRLVGLVEQSYEGKLCLPNFQRDFVWPREHVADLIRSVLRNYYIGSLLLLRCSPQLPPFAPVFLRGGPPATKEPRPELLVLDGQQRLSSLLYALTAPDLPLKDSSQRRWFYVNLDLLVSDPGNDEIVFDRSPKDLEGIDKLENQYKQHILPCTRLLRSTDFYKWRDGFEDWLRESNLAEEKTYRGEWRDAWTKAVTEFQTYDVPLVELTEVKESDTESIGRVCAIFEKLNSTGVELSVYDLLTARLYRYKKYLHEYWAATCKKHALIAQWSKGKADTNKFGVLILRTLALLRDLEVRPSILIDLKPDNFEQAWNRAAAAFERALELLTHIGPDGFGVFDAKWLPGYGLIPVLAALRAQIEDHDLGDVARADLRQWYWCNVFMERYSSAVESKSRKDYVEMVNYWKDHKAEPEVFRQARQRFGASTFSVRDSASRASSIYSGIFCLLALRNARDWRLAESIQLQKLNDHHIFPQAYLRRHGVTGRDDVNSVVNRTLISDTTNAKIKDKAPAEYLMDTSIFPSGVSAYLVSPHFLGDDALSMMKDSIESLPNDEASEAYELFRVARESEIVAEIRRVCGIDSSVSK